MSDNPSAGRTLFIADLHLCQERPQANGRFFHFLQHTARGADGLYILGDLFEYWIGDDDQSSLALEIAEGLSALVRAGTPVFFMHGNRDFLLAQKFAEQASMTLLTDPTLINLYGASTLLMHGDTLCTDDTGYQRLRGLLRQSWLQKLLLALPRSVRYRMAQSARSGSERSKANKSYAIMDVNPAAVTRALLDCDAARLIHGHTHRPGHHVFPIPGKPAERWVLHDWYDTGGYLSCGLQGCELFAINS